MPKDSWMLRPLKDGTVEMTMVKWSGKTLGTVVKPDEVGALLAGLCATFRNAHAMSGRPPAPDKFEGTIPPIVPDGVGLLHPAPNKTVLSVIVGESYFLIDISDLDTEPLARALLMASAGGDQPN